MGDRWTSEMNVKLKSNLYVWPVNIFLIFDTVTEPADVLVPNS